jgi:predicted nucleic acid-binding protein
MSPAYNMVSDILLRKGGVLMRIYFDVCCLNRPYDDMKQNRIRLEKEAILAILSRCNFGSWVHISSNIVDYEINQINDYERRSEVQALNAECDEKIILNQKIFDRAGTLESYGIKSYDAYHVALAEAANADVFLTTDDKLIKLAEKAQVNVKVINPVTWVMEVNDNE